MGLFVGATLGRSLVANRWWRHESWRGLASSLASMAVRRGEVGLFWLQRRGWRAALLLFAAAEALVACGVVAWWRAAMLLWFVAAEALVACGSL